MWIWSKQCALYKLVVRCTKQNKSNPRNNKHQFRSCKKTKKESVYEIGKNEKNNTKQKMRFFSVAHELHRMEMAWVSGIEPCRGGKDHSQRQNSIPISRPVHWIRPWETGKKTNVAQKKQPKSGDKFSKSPCGRVRYCPSAGAFRDWLIAVWRLVRQTAPKRNDLEGPGQPVWAQSHSTETLLASGFSSTFDHSPFLPFSILTLLSFLLSQYISVAAIMFSFFFHSPF